MRSTLYSLIISSILARDWRSLLGDCLLTISSPCAVNKSSSLTATPDVYKRQEEEDGDSEAYILKEIADENDDVVYEMVEDDNELAALGKVFAELIDDADIEY